MSHAKHRKQSAVERHPLRAWLIASIGVLIGMGFLVACASGSPSQASEQQPPPFVMSEWHGMAVPELEYACDPTLGVIVRRTGEQTGSGYGEHYKTWTISVTPYSQLTTEQKTKMCGGQR